MLIYPRFVERVIFDKKKKNIGNIFFLKQDHRKNQYE